MNIAPETEIEEVEEQTRQGGGGAELGGSASVPTVGEVSAGVDFSGDMARRDSTQTRRRVNNQFLFNKLVDELEQEDGDTITRIPSESSGDLSQGDVVQIEATIQTDAVFRLLEVLALFDEVSGDDLLDSEYGLEEVQELLYSDSIGVSLAVENSRFSYSSSLDTSNLWVDTEQLFMGDKKYTILGRISDTYGGDEKWDYTDIARTLSTVIENQTMDDLRDVLSEFIELLDGARQDFELPDFAGVSANSFDDLGDVTEQSDKSQSSLGLDIDQSEIAIEGPGVEVEPIAIYW